MTDEEMEIYPIEHKGKVYNINAFHLTPEDEFMGPGKMFSCEVEGALFEVDVHGYEVVVFRRSPE
jgi:hypothetical protein